MEPRPTMAMRMGVVERAFQLAASGEFNRPGEISSHLRREGYLNAPDHIHFPFLSRQLRDTCRAAASRGSLPSDTGMDRAADPPGARNRRAPLEEAV